MKRPLPATKLQATLACMDMCERGRRWVGAQTYRGLLASHERIPEAFVRWFLFRLRLCNSGTTLSLSALQSAVAPRLPMTQAGLDRLVRFLYAEVLPPKRTWGIGQVLEGRARTVIDDYAPYQIREGADGQVSGLVLARPELRRAAIVGGAQRPNGRLTLRLSDGELVRFTFRDARLGGVTFEHWPV